MKLEYTIEGEGSDVLLLHGFPSNMFFWNDIKNELIQNNKKVLVPEQRGYPLSNINKHDDWKKDLTNYNLEKSLGWELAAVKRIDKFETIIETQYGNKGVINFNDIDWTRKEFKKLFKRGDII